MDGAFRRKKHVGKKILGEGGNSERCAYARREETRRVALTTRL